MDTVFHMLGDLPPATIAQKLREIGDDEAAAFYEQHESPTEANALLEGRFIPHKWLDTSHQYGFIPPFDTASGRYQKIISATSMPPDPSLIKQRVNIHLDWLHTYDYPRSYWNNEDTIHTILFTFEAQNQTEANREALAFNQTYHARTGQDAAVTGHPIFIGLTIGANGIGFACETVNVSNSSDEQLLAAITSTTTQTGLHLLTTAQPALAPFVDMAKKLSITMLNNNKNVGVQRFSLGLDFDTGGTGARLAIGSYVIIQASGMNWNDWCFDSETGAICTTSDQKKVLPYNAIIFRVSRYRE